MLAGLERLRGEVEVSLAGCGDDDEIDGWIGEGFVDGAEDARRRIGLRGGIACALDDDGEFEAGDGGDERAVEDLAGETVAEDSAANGGFGHGGIVRRRVQ